jgi:hypothetical protein
MKFGSFEGTPDELKNVCENHGFDPSSFIKTPPKFRPKLWIVITLISVFTIISICTWTIDLPETAIKAGTILNLVLVIVITAIIHLRFERWELTALSFFGGLIVLSMSLGFITPKEAINDLKDRGLKKEGQ